MNGARILTVAGNIRGLESGIYFSIDRRADVDSRGENPRPGIRNLFGDLAGANFEARQFEQLRRPGIGNIFPNWADRRF